MEKKKGPVTRDIKKAVLELEQAQLNEADYKSRGKEGFPLLKLRLSLDPQNYLDPRVIMTHLFDPSESIKGTIRVIRTGFVFN